MEYLQIKLYSFYVPVLFLNEQTFQLEIVGDSV